MFKVIDCIITEHDPLIVFFAASIWVLGSIAFFLALGRAQECNAKRHSTWILIGSLAGGLGVWATHFVAMLAYDIGFPIGFSFDVTFASALIAIVGFWISLQILGDYSTKRCIAAGILLMATIATMHFTGMAGLKVRAQISYDWLSVAGSLIVGAVCFCGAFLLFSRIASGRRVYAAAAASVIAVCAIHFTGMSAATLVYDPTLPEVSAGESRSWLITAVMLSTMIVICLTGTATLIDRYLTDLKGFVAATMEGIVIVRDNQILESNDRFADLIGYDANTLIAMDLDNLLACADGRPATDLREKPVEAVPRGQDNEAVFEVVSHEIEYRGRACRVLGVRDLTETKAAQRQVEYLACHDGLTGLPNRTLFHDRLTHAMGYAKRTGDKLALLALDLDRFKAVNDLFGHAEGDRVLKQVAKILQTCVRNSDTVARLGGDEFVILQVGAEQPEGAQALSTRIMDVFREEMDLACDPTAVGVSIGIAVCPEDGATAETLHNAADIALYRAKTSGRGLATFFDSQMDSEVREKRLMESDLRHAITEKQLHIAYQPLVETSDNKITGYEALLRWIHPVRGEVPPDVFVPVAEETGAILSIGEWVLRQACKDAAEWAEPLTLSVNVSAIQFQVSNLRDVIYSAINDAGLDPRRLELEITETALLKNRENTVRILRELKDDGVRVVMDDFGTGYSSLGNLQCFPFDKIKIDSSFIHAMETDEAALSIIRAIVGIGNSLSLPVVAEGIETEHQRALVKQEGCLMAQGYFFGRPGDGPLLRQDTGKSAVA